MRKILPYLIVLVIVSCASNSGVVPIGSGMYMVSRQAATGFSGMGTLTADAMREANDFCTAQKLTSKILSTNEAKPPYILGNFPKVDLQFTCVEPNQNAPLEISEP